MKGIILAGDSGERLHPLTIGIPKQLLPVYDKPMIYYPIYTLVQAGIEDILIITTAEQQPLFQKALGDGSRFKANFSYTVQDEPKGIAQAISIGEEFIGKESVCLITGDMIIDGDNVSERIKKAIRAVKKSGNATIFVENKTYPDQYGQVLMNKEWKVEDVVGTSDKPHYLSIASFYVFPNSVIKHACCLDLSERGRLEITDVNKRFFEECKLQVQVLDSKCIWLDTNTIENIWRCGDYMRKKSIKK